MFILFVVFYPEVGNREVLFDKEMFFVETEDYLWFLRAGVELFVARFCLITIYRNL